MSVDLIFFPGNADGGRAHLPYPHETAAGAASSCFPGSPRLALCKPTRTTPWHADATGEQVPLGSDNRVVYFPKGDHVSCPNCHVASTEVRIQLQELALLVAPDARRMGMEIISEKRPSPSPVPHIRTRSAATTTSWSLPPTTTTTVHLSEDVDGYLQFLVVLKRRWRVAIRDRSGRTDLGP